MTRKSHLAFALASGISALAFASGTAYADAAAADASAADAASPDDGGITDIVVTAERRDVSLQQASLSVSAVTSDALKAANITNATGLNGIVPGLVVAVGGGGERDLSIRGVGSETPENTNTQPGVSYHIDGVYIFNSIAASAAFIDVAQVEVLRGPQGTLFGQGSTGGTINVVTKQPSTDALSGDVSAGIGNYNYKEGNAALNVPVGDTLAIRGAFQFAKHDGYAHATKVPGVAKYALDDEDNTGWRIGAKWAPTSNLSVILNAIRYSSDTHGPEQKNILDPAPDPRVVTQDYPGRDIVKTQLYTATIRWETPFAVVKSISGYQKLHSEQSWDSDGLDPALFSVVSYVPEFYFGYNYDHTALWQSDTKSWTQEVNITSNTTGPLTWVAGAVYLHSKNSQYINEYKGSDSQPFRPALPTDTAFNDPAVGALTYAELSSITREEYAFYAQATYALTSRLKLTGGIRYNHDHATGLSDSLSGGMTHQTAGAYLQPHTASPYTDHAWTGKAAIEYQFDPAHMVYFSYTRGFKPGGINASVASGFGALPILGWTDGVKPSFKNETIGSFEIGTKNRFAGNTLQLNASAFLYNYQNMQFLEEDPVLFAKGISNAPRAREWGAEVEASWLPTPQLRFDATGSWLEGKFTAHYGALDPQAAAEAAAAAGYTGVAFYNDFYAASVARDSARADIYGNRLPKLPRWQGSLAATWTGDVGPGTLTARGQVIYRGKFNSRIFNNGSVDVTPAYTQVNALLKYEPADTGLDLTLRVTNLFDVNGKNARFSDPYGSYQVFDTYIPPRQFIVSFGYKF